MDEDGPTGLIFQQRTVSGYQYKMWLIHCTNQQAKEFYELWFVLSRIMVAKRLSVCEYRWKYTSVNEETRADW